MSRLDSLLTGAILGAGAMYFFDPLLGRRRRALVEDQCRRLSREATEGLDASWRDLANRARGTVAEPGVHAFAKWSPGTRLLAGGLGGLLIANCLARRGLRSTLLGTVGFGMILCAMSGKGSCGAATGGERGETSSTTKLRGSGAPHNDVGYFHPPGAREEPGWPSSPTPAPQAAEPSGYFPPAF